MSGRFKAYTLINMLMNLGLGIAALFYADTFKAPSYQTIAQVMPLRTWGGIFMALVFLAILALASNSVALVRFLFSLSAAVMATWGFGFLTAFIQGKALGPTGFLVWLALAAQNVVVVATPGITELEHAIGVRKNVR